MHYLQTQTISLSRHLKLFSILACRTAGFQELTNLKPFRLIERLNGVRQDHCIHCIAHRALHAEPRRIVADKQSFYQII